MQKMGSNFQQRQVPDTGIAATFPIPIITEILQVIEERINCSFQFYFIHGIKFDIWSH